MKKYHVVQGYRWWVDPGWKTGAHHSQSIATPAQMDRGEKHNKRLVG